MVASLVRISVAGFGVRTTARALVQPGQTRQVEGVTMCWCPPGQFVMGSPVTEPDRRSDEGPVTTRLTRGFWMARHEVTQAEWQRVVGAFPDRPPTAQFGIGDTVPMYWVNYHEAEDFCARLTLRARSSGAIRPSESFRLPTEAQWEYACRAGTTTTTTFGNTLDATQANLQGGPARAVEVGRYRANAWGLHDMHGNIFEWCRDWYHAALPGGVDPDLSDRRGSPNRDGSYSRSRRGGAWNDPVMYCRSACRSRYEPDRRSDHIGFRVILESSEAQ